VERLEAFSARVNAVVRYARAASESRQRRDSSTLDALLDRVELSVRRASERLSSGSCQVAVQAYRLQGRPEADARKDSTPTSLIT